MSAATTRVLPAAGPLVLSADRVDGAGGDWPYTTRILPWGLALFLCLLWLMPVSAVEVPISLPVEATADRVFLGLLTLVWISVIAAGGPLAPRWRSSPVHIAGAVFLVIVAISLFLGYRRAAADGAEFELATKRLALLGSYVLFFLIVTSTLRPAELPRFVVLLVGLAAVAAAGTVFESLSGTNVFYDWARAALPGFHVPSAPSGTQSGRKIVVGPTRHGLAITTALSMALPFALLLAVRARSLAGRLASLAAVVLIIAGTIATVRKTGLLAPAAVALVLMLYRPREAGKILGVLVVSAAGLAVLVPTAARSVYDQLFVDDVAATASSRGRLSDYDAIRPDVLGHLLFGRGYGTYDPLRYRILDNELLMQLLTVGVLGLLAFFGVLVAGVFTAHAAARADRADLRLVGIGTVGAIAAFTLTTATFDALSFVQVPYLLLLVLACAVVARPPTERERARR